MASPEPREDPGTQEQIIEAAHRVFMRRGTAGARTQEIADEAGVNRALLHYYYRTKERLAEAVFLRAARIMFPSVLGVLDSEGGLREKLQRLAEVYTDLLTANPYLPGYILSELHHRHGQFLALLGSVLPLEEVRKKVMGALQAQLDAEAAAGRLRPTLAEDFVTAFLSQMIFPFAAAPMLQAILGLGPEARAAMAARRREGLADAVLRSFAPDPPPHPPTPL